jgi:hypothetical protein
MGMHPKFDDSDYFVFFELLFGGSKEKAIECLINKNLVSDSQKKAWLTFFDNIKDSEKSKLIDYFKLNLDDMVEDGEYVCSKTPKQIVSNFYQCYRVFNQRDLSVDYIRSKTILDFGAGVYRPLCVAAILYANGFDKAYAFEPYPLKHQFPIASLIQLIIKATISPSEYIFSGISSSEFVSRLKSLDTEHIHNKFKNFETGECNSISLGGVELINDISVIPDNYLDFQFSNAVLEHVSDLSYFFSKLKNITKSDGEGYHIVDFADHRYYDDNTISPMEKYYDGILDEINGLTPSQIETLILNAGWVANKCNAMTIPEDYHRNEQREIVDKYKNYSKEELFQHINYYQLKMQ